MKSKKLTIGLAIAVCVLCLLALIIGLFIHRVSNYIDTLKPDTTVSTDETGSVQATQPEQNVSSLFDISGLIDSAKALKNDLVSALQALKREDYETARAKIKNIPKNIQPFRSSLNLAKALVGGLFPSVEEQLNNLSDLLDAADMATEKLLLPAIDLMEKYPLSELHAENGIRVAVLAPYLDFLESVMPDIEKLVNTANAIDYSIIDSDGKIAEYLQTATDLLDFYKKDPTILAKLRAMAGVDGDRLYLVAAQTAAEVRATGGFPGSIGTLEIKNGILTLGNFKTVYKSLLSYTPSGIQITAEEKRLFNYLSGMGAPRDADLCPDFTRVGKIWAKAYEDRNGRKVAGVITMTPCIVQRLLAVIGEEVILSDGLILNGENAAKVLQYDMYFKYYGKTWVANRDTISDELFQEAAQKTMKKVFSSLSLSHILDYVKVAKESFEDRTIMLWMKDEAEQATVVAMDWDGGLNTDPEEPKAGVFFNCTDPGKMGWFLLVDTEIGEAKKNADGSCSYTVSVTFTNNMTKEEFNKASSYITGDLGGAFQGSAYFFAPAGGTVSNFSTSNNLTIRSETYQGLQLGFLSQFRVGYGKSFTVTYTVTTAPGVDAPLEIMQTPTAQQS